MTGSWREKDRGYPRTDSTCLGKAALKTHALQTLRDCRSSPYGAKRLECVRFIGAFRPARDDPQFMAPKDDFGIVVPLRTHSLALSPGDKACADETESRDSSGLLHEHSSRRELAADARFAERLLTGGAPTGL